MQSALTTSRTAVFSPRTAVRSQVRSIWRGFANQFYSLCFYTSVLIIKSCHHYLRTHGDKLSRAHSSVDHEKIVGFVLQARRSIAVYAAARPLWQPGGTPPAHLDGSLPGDFGFDPLNLGSNKAALDW